jgi:uncharacterized protein (TIGR02246 family)
LVLGFAFRASWAAEPSTLTNEISDSARDFVEAYDRGDAAAIAALWTDDAEYSVAQETVTGRPTIQRLYEEFLRANPGSKMEIRIESIRMLAPTVAIEQGIASVSNSPTAPPSSSAYTAVHVKQDGKWRMASVRESEPFIPQESRDLENLSWLVGNWAAKGDAAEVDVQFEWMANKNFLRGETSLTPNGKQGTKQASTQVIGRDPVSGDIVSWFFDGDGGQGYGVWMKDGERWLLRTQGATSDGTPTTATNILYPADDNIFSWKSTNRTVDGQPLPSTSEIVVERVPRAEQADHWLRVTTVALRQLLTIRSLNEHAQGL